MLELNVIYFSIGTLGFTAGPKRRAEAKTTIANIGHTDTGATQKAQGKFNRMQTAIE